MKIVTMTRKDQQIQRIRQEINDYTEQLNDYEEAGQDAYAETCLADIKALQQKLAKLERR